MNESDIVRELSRRTSLPEEPTAAVLHAIQELIHEGTLDCATLLKLSEPPGPPDDPAVVERLITRAKKHPLGLEFLVSGFLATVAITLGAHAFTVEAARHRLEKEQNEKKDQEEKEEDPK